VNIIFRNEDDQELGRITHENIDEILIPAFKEDKHDMFIKRVFKSHPEINTWQIQSMVIDNLDVYLKLRPIPNQRSFKEFTKSQNKIAEQILKKYSIIEVDFGFYSAILDSHGNKLIQEQNTHVILKGEIHKRRPCLVLKVKRNTIQVIPLSTSDDNQNDAKCVKLASLPTQLIDRYHKKPCYALLNMIQTISSARAYPPQYRQVQSIHRVYQLDSIQQREIEHALAKTFNKDTIRQHECLNLQLNNVKQERKKLLDKYRDLKTETTRLEHEVTSLSQQNKKLKTLLTQIEQDWELNLDLNTLLEEK
jgi:uncharacterized protein YifN (PemK superfamily)